MTTRHRERPQWHVGTWWVVRVMQRADWLMSSDAPWVGPIRWRFEVIEEDDGMFQVEVTIPDGDGPYRAEMRIRQEDFTMADGMLTVGEHDIPMGLDFLAMAYEAHLPGIDLEGVEGEEVFRFGPSDRDEEPLVLHTFTGPTRGGGMQVSSRDLPYHLHVTEADYTLDLESWAA